MVHRTTRVECSIRCLRIRKFIKNFLLFRRGEKFLLLAARETRVIQFLSHSHKETNHPGFAALAMKKTLARIPSLFSPSQKRKKFFIKFWRRKPTRSPQTRVVRCTFIRVTKQLPVANAAATRVSPQSTFKHAHNSCSHPTLISNIAPPTSQRGGYHFI